MFSSSSKRVDVRSCVMKTWGNFFADLVMKKKLSLNIQISWWYLAIKDAGTEVKRFRILEGKWEKFKRKGLKWLDFQAHTWKSFAKPQKTFDQTWTLSLIIEVRGFKIFKKIFTYLVHTHYRVCWMESRNLCFSSATCADVRTCSQPRQTLSYP